MGGQPAILCIGAMVWDVIGQSFNRMRLGTDTPGSIAQFPGGVALNVAMSLAAMDHRPLLLSAIGRDSAGEVLVDEISRIGVDTSHVYVNPAFSTDYYLAIEDPEGLIAAVADTRCLETAGAHILAPLRDGRIGSASHPFPGTIMLDGNLTTALMNDIAHDPCFGAADLRIAPASPEKAERIAPLFSRPRSCFYVNLAEAETLAGRPCPDSRTAAEAIVARGAERVIVTNGAHAVADAMRGAPTLTATPPRVEIIRVTGAGDRLIAAHFVAELDGADRQTALVTAVRSATEHVSGKDLL